MRKSNSTNSLVIVSNHIKSIYDDRWDIDTLHYTGMGTTGDQSLNFLQNKTLSNCKTNGISVHLFEVFRDKEYTYTGEVILVDTPYTEQQPDQNGNLRQVYIFPLQLNSKFHSVLAEDKLHVYKVKQKKAKRLSIEELAKRASQSTRKISCSQQTTTIYDRNVWVVEYTKRLANGICQLCHLPAPFNNLKGEPYLETHHIIWLSRNGIDTPENTVALCPNCHKKMHVLDLPNDVALLTNRANNF
ncbi:HNH endonuclease [Shewanella sp. KX20019]|nr:HNH endonuclease [Shewanella sp. KX20019]